HFEAGIMCADCHGGNPADEENAMEPSEGFVGKPEPKDIPKFCSKCHSDAKMMRAFNQRSDQYDLYAGSVHGRKHSAGDEAAPTCVSCHGKHKILRVKDPKSTVHRNNLPQTCGGCHAKKEVFGPRKKPHNQLDLYKKSWHYEKFSQGDLLVPTCMDCHGNHGILPARSERTQTVCFNCHSAQAENYKASGHWAAFKKQGEPACLHCHKNHDVTRPTVAKFNGKGDSDCIACHEEGSPAYTAGLEIQSLMKSTINAVETASEEMADFKDNAHGGFEIGGIEERLEKAKTGLAELRVLTHKMDLESLKKESETVLTQAADISEDIHTMLAEIKTRKIGLVGAWFVFLGLMYSIWLMGKAFERKED
ncbi:MAG: cytochrome c3 family protein, partial [Nitrospinota bacterium]|nr:cytochrome c3 family protein [Nitrospinota bacterium]